jgi:hypothetical protein
MDSHKQQRKNRRVNCFNIEEKKKALHGMQVVIKIKKLPVKLHVR